MTLPTPAEIRAYLDEYVIGQEDAKKVLSVALYNHYKRVSFDTGGIEIKKSNILMVGPTGSGKTHIVSTLARMLNVPFIAADSTSLIGSGVRGIDSIIASLIVAANYDIGYAERGIIFLDEVDKLASKYNRSSETIQQALLKTIEGTIATVSVQGQSAQINTGNILFVVGGAFVDLEQHINDRVGGNNVVGITVTITELIKKVVPEDFKNFGLIPELLGRLPIVVALEELSREALIDILTKPKNNLIAQYKQIFAMDNMQLVFTRDSLERIADKAIKLGTGARGLHTVVEETLRDTMYAAPGERNLNKVTITAEVVGKSGGAVFDFVHAKEDPEIKELSIKPTKDTVAAFE